MNLRYDGHPIYGGNIYTGNEMIVMDLRKAGGWVLSPNRDEIIPSGN